MPLRRWIGSACAVLLTLGLAACNYTGHFQKSAYDYASRAKDDPKTMRARSYGTLSNTYDPRQHENRYFEYSSKASYQVSNLPGVASALVMLTDKNAYVALTTDWSATGTRSRGGASRYEQDNTGTMDGVYNTDTGSPYWDLRQLATPYNSYFTHQNAADLSPELRQTIGDLVRSLHPAAREVHISANREFVNRMLAFARASWRGESLDRLTPDFNRLVRYMFGVGEPGAPIPPAERDRSGQPSPAGTPPTGSR